MTIANVSKGSSRGLPPALQIAQESIHLPEVQDMLRRLSEYHLGICMPHRHDGQTGEFQPLADDVMQVEAGTQVSFRPAGEIADQHESFLAVGWSWRAGTPRPVAVCEMVREASDSERCIKHKMLERKEAS